jgi:hypothetical protein
LAANAKEGAMRASSSNISEGIRGMIKGIVARYFASCVADVIHSLQQRWKAALCGCNAAVVQQ